MSDADTATPPRAPPSASARHYLSRGLPAVYRDPEGPAAEDPFVVRWMGGLEEVLDPTVALIDNLAWHLHAGYAPEPIVRLLLGWLGLSAVAELPIDGARRVLHHAESVARRRGTRRGLEDVLTLAFPALDFDVLQSANFTEGDDPEERRLAPAPFLSVRCTRKQVPAGAIALTPEEEARGVRALIEIRLPVGVPYILYLPELDPAAA
jgi:phage tail-like protein